MLAISSVEGVKISEMEQAESVMLLFHTIRLLRSFGILSLLGVAATNRLNGVTSLLFLELGP